MSLDDPKYNRTNRRNPDDVVPIAGLDVVNDGGTLKPRDLVLEWSQVTMPIITKIIPGPTSVEHDWRLWPITWMGLDVVCIGCGQQERWPIACGGNRVPPANFDRERDWDAHLDVMVEGEWVSDALACGYRATARTAERALAACINHQEEHHG